MGTFSEEVEVRAGDAGHYTAQLSHDWDLFPLPQGGVISAFALRAAEQELARADQTLRSCTAVFAGQVSAGDLEISTTVLRRGRSASQVLATVRNVGAPAGATAIAVFGASRPGPDLLDVTPPQVPEPGACRSYREAPPPGVEMFPPPLFGAGSKGGRPWATHPGRSTSRTVPMWEPGSALTSRPPTAREHSTHWAW